MRHISFCAALGVVALLGSASFAAQSYISPDTRYTNPPVTQVAVSGAAADTGIIKSSYESPDVCGGCSTCSDCDSGCDSGCGSDCCGYDWREAADSAGFIAGYEFLWLKPHFSSGTNYGFNKGVGVLGSYAEPVVIEVAEVETEVYGFPTNYNLAPRVWIGHQWCSGFAVRLRYWQFDHSLGNVAMEVTSGDNSYYYAPGILRGIHASSGDFLAIQNGLKADVIDLDLTQDFNWCNTRLTLGGGISYAGLRIDRGLAVSGLDYLEREVMEAEEYATRFEGIGPTVLAELKRRIGCSGISIVGGVRGTILFGRERILSNYVEVVYNPESPPDVYVQTYSSTANRTRAIVAASIGVQYDYEICCGTDVFARLSWEGQYWNGFGNPVATEGDLAFQGLGIAFGLRR